MILAPVCKQSGYLAGENCCDIDSVWISQVEYTNICPYHQKFI